MAVKLASHVPQTAPNDGVIDELKPIFGEWVIDAYERVGEVTFVVTREGLWEVLFQLNSAFEYQQLMEIAGVDYPDRAERFEVVYHLLSLTKNHRIRVKVSTDEQTPVPSVTDIWPVAGWLEREVYDMYGVPFSGNDDLRRILTDYGFEGFPFRKDFPLTGHVELRYSEAEKRVVYEPVSLPQDFRAFEFLMPWEGPEYVLPGDEKAKPEAPGAPSPAPAPSGSTTQNAKTPAETPKTTEGPADTGAGAPADKAATKQARKPRAKKAEGEVSKPSPKSRAPRKRKGDA